MMHNSKFIILSLSAVGFGLSFVSCENDKIKIDPNQDSDEQQVIVSNINYFYQRPSYIGNVSGKMKEALAVCVPNQVGSVDRSTGLVLLGNLNEIPFEVLQTAYEGGATIAVENPKTSDFETFFASHPDWEGYTNGTNLDGDLLYSFDNDGSTYVIEYSHPVDFESIPYEESPEEAEEDLYIDQINGEDVTPETEYVPEYYKYLGSWLRHLNQDDINDAASAENPKKDPQGSSNYDKINEFADAFQISGAATFYIDPRFRKYGAGQYWEIKDAQVDVSYGLTIYPIHVYDGSSSSGNFFIVEATTTVDSSKAWKQSDKGALCQVIGGTHCHHAGYYTKDATIHFQLIDETGKAVAEIPGGSPIFPDNEIALTEYSNKKSFEFGGGASVTAGKKDTETSLGGEAKMSFGWTWTNEVNFNQKDVTIVKSGLNLTTGNVGWALNFLNTPCFDRGYFRWINIDKNINSQRAQDFKAGWIWYDKNAKDESKKKYRVRVYIEGHCQAGSFKSSKSDWRNKSQKFKYLDKATNTTYDYAELIADQVITVETRIMGMIKLQNKSNGYISDIKLWNEETPQKYLYYNKQNIEAGQDLELGAFFSRNPDSNDKLNKFRMSYEIENTDGTVDIYEYRHKSENTFELNEKKILQLFTDVDFKKVGSYRP